MHEGGSLKGTYKQAPTLAEACGGFDVEGVHLVHAGHQCIHAWVASLRPCWDFSCPRTLIGDEDPQALWIMIFGTWCLI
jgi:hypothetical protein